MKPVETSLIAPVKRWIAKNPVAGFLLMLFPLNWIVFAPPLLGKSGLGIIPIDPPYLLSVLVSTLLGLTGLAFLVTRIADGKAGTRALRRQYYQFRAGPQWYLAAIFGPPLVLLLTGIALYGPSVLGPIGSNVAKIPGTFLAQVALSAVLINVWEEGGWMAFMTVRLQRRLGRFGPVWASVIVAPFFGGVHIPLFFINGAEPPGQSFLVVAFFLLFGQAVQVRILVTWLYNATGGSLPVVALFHAAMDVTGGVALLTFFPSIDGAYLFLGLAIVAVAVIVLTRGRLGYRGEPSQTTVPLREQPAVG